jgi:hypothetical protein
VKKLKPKFDKPYEMLAFGHLALNKKQLVELYSS